MKFLNKIVLVTGGGSGIGEATSIAFVKEGATVVIVDKDATRAKETGKKCEPFGVSPTVLCVDLCSDAEVKIMTETVINLHGKLDVLVNCAGILRAGTLLEDNFIDKFDEVMNVNMRALAFVTHVMAPHLVKSKGNIINVASAAATSLPRDPYSAYSVSKAAVLQFTKAIASELGPLGVRVNCVSPGFVKTNIYVNGGLTLDVEKASNQTSLGRISGPDEIADLIVYLSSVKAKSITGSNYLIDCGVTLLR